MKTLRYQPTVFIVHENQTVYDYLCRCLSEAGYHVLAADSGLGAVALASSVRRPIDILLACPRHGVLTGVDLARWIHRTHPRLKYLEISPVAPEEERFPCAAIPLPIEKDGLLHRVRNSLSDVAQAA